MKENIVFDTIVVGAGVAGISASVKSVLLGRKTLLLESTANIGGRARSFLDSETGDMIDNGQHAMMGCYEHFLDIVNELGTINLLKKQSHLTVPFVYADGKRDILQTNGFAGMRGPLGMAIGLLGLKQISILEKRKIMTFALRLKLKLCKPGSMTAYEFLLSEHQSEHSIHVLWSPIILATLNGSPDTVSAVLFVTVLTLAFFGKGDASSLMLSNVGLSQLFEPLNQWLEQRGSECKTSCSVDEIIIEHNEVKGIRLSDGTLYKSRRVICAIPPKAMVRLLPKQYREDSFFSPALDYTFSPIISLYLWFDKPFPSIEFAAMIDTATQWVFNKRLITGSSNKEALLALTISAGNEIVTQSTEEIARHCAEEIKQCFPEMQNAALLHWKVIKEKSATFLASPEMEEKRLSQKTPIKGFALAGDWTDTSLPATLEGAALSGYRAVETV